MRKFFICMALGWLPLLADTGSAPPLPDSSLFQLDSNNLDSRWQRDDGKSMTLSQLRGQASVVALFFSHCSGICPMLVGQLKQLEQAMPPRVKNGMHFVLVTLDVDQDDNQALAKYRQEMNLSADRWILLHGSQDDTRALANLLGVQYTPKKDDGQIQHTGLITLLDREGRIRGQWTSIPDRQAVVKRLDSLMGQR